MRFFLGGVKIKFRACLRGKSLGPDVSGKDVVELMDVYVEELTTGELKITSLMIKKLLF